MKNDITSQLSQAIKNGDKTFKTSGEMGLRDIRIAEKVYESAAEGGVSVEV